MTGPTPTLPDIEKWNPQHFDDHSAHWRDLAQRRTSVLEQIVGDAAHLDGTGQWRDGGDGMAAAVTRHDQTATSEADELNAAAKTATNYSDQLTRQQQNILKTVQQAQQQKFDVSPTWQVTDTIRDPMVQELVRQSCASIAEICRSKSARSWQLKHSQDRIW